MYSINNEVMQRLSTITFHRVLNSVVHTYPTTHTDSKPKLRFFKCEWDNLPWSYSSQSLGKWLFGSQSGFSPLEVLYKNLTLWQQVCLVCYDQVRITAPYHKNGSSYISMAETTTKRIKDIIFGHFHSFFSGWKLK